MKIPVNTSVRHVHLTEEQVQELFGHELTVHHNLYQDGYFAANETVDVCGPKGTIERVRVLGPCRDKAQVELSATDAMRVGIDSVTRLSGNTEGTPGCGLLGPKGSILLNEGVIRAWRHVHMSKTDAYIFGVKNGSRMKLTVHSERPLAFHGMIACVGEFKLEVHIDTDEANACDLETATDFLLTRCPYDIQRSI
jgi:propanediol utilization protein